jgi:hypothetical protein
MEYAAGLLDIKVDCTELMRAGEAGDEEASAASAVVTILKESFSDRDFSAKEVVKVIEAKDVKWLDPSKIDEVAKAQGEALADALDELAGRRLDRPTPHKIGKLFQKCLVGRPALIRKADLVATLRKTPGHNENTYRIEIGTVGQNNPHIPHIPRDKDQAAAGSGNVGNEGKVSGPLRRWRI